jgi:hypothetical protein
MDHIPKIIQISTNSSDEDKTCLYALDSDGDVWDLQWTREGWIWVCIGSPFNDAQ